jgi:hypothetical protein
LVRIPKCEIFNLTAEGHKRFTGCFVSDLLSIDDEWRVDMYAIGAVRLANAENRQQRRTSSIAEIEGAGA